MKQQNKIIIIAVFSLFLQSCTYQHANIERNVNIYDKKPYVKIKYNKSIKGKIIKTVKNGNTRGVFFGILAYKVIIPFLWVDHKWIFHFQTVDKDYNPVMEESIKLESISTSGGNDLSRNPRYRIFSSEKGFIVVYPLGDKFYFTEFNTKGEIIHKKTKFYNEKDRKYGGVSVMNITYKKAIIYLFVRVSEDSKKQNIEGVNLVKYNIRNEETTVNKGFISCKTAWERQNRMEVFNAKGDSLLIFWSSFNNNKYSNNYKTTIVDTTRFYYAKCSVKDTKCSNIDTVLSLNTNRWTIPEIMNQNDSLQLLVSDVYSSKNIKFWHQKLDKNGNLQSEMFEVDSADYKIYLEYLRLMPIGNSLICY